MDRHYLVYARQGTLRLEADGQRWTLPPARAALIEANSPVTISIPVRLVSASVLFDRKMFTPPCHLSVFDMSPLARELVGECLEWTGEDDAQPPYIQQLFRTLAMIVSHLAKMPSPCVMPVPTSRELARALALTEARASDSPNFEAIAHAVGQSPRTLSRRFSEEIHMTWREALRRIRVIRAIEILAEGNNSITEVAMQVGYTSLSAFNAAFRQITGQTPTQYRLTFSNQPRRQGT
jgi:AraC-like DNA-binding protein